MFLKSHSLKLQQLSHLTYNLISILRDGIPTNFTEVKRTHRKDRLTISTYTSTIDSGF